MKSEQENKEKQENTELHKFMICDKIFGAYIHCINEFTDKNKDCEKISNVLDNINICNIRTK
jgi:hypothetical protein